MFRELVVLAGGGGGETAELANLFEGADNAR
jgi:hypothetical protein